MKQAPLHGIKVVDLGHTVMGQSAGMILADLGATVIKVEPAAKGDPTRHLKGFGIGYFGYFNRNKQSIAIDLKSPEGLEVARRLIGEADVLIENFGPGTMERLQLDYERLRKDNPRLVWCTLTSFGQDGPLADAAGHDLTFLGYSGLLSRLAGSGPLPVPDTTVAVPLAGALGAVGILAALAARRTALPR